MTLAYDPLAPEQWQDPYPSYRQLRDAAPVHYSPASQVWCVSRFDDVTRVLRSPEIFSSQAAFDVLFSQMTSNIGWRDVRDLAIPLPVEVIAEMLGIEPERREQFKGWSDKLVAGFSSSDRKNARPAFLSAMTEMQLYLRGIAADRRNSPRDDLISVLVDPAHGQTLDENAIMEFIALLLIAGTMIPADARVAVLLGSANRDERRFQAPDHFDVDRDTRGHVSFGFGVHFCLGASLARMEAESALRALIPELVGLRPPEPEPPMIDSVLVRGRSSIPLQGAS